MAQTQLHDILGKQVVTSDGVHLGTVADLRENTMGTISELRVQRRHGGEEADQLSFVEYECVNGVFHIPISKFKSATDQILVE